MAVFLFILLAILLFWKYADKSMFRMLFPMTITAIFIRFLEQFIIIDWLHILVVHGKGMLPFWIPIFADLTVWPISGYLFIQYLPKRHRVLYGVGWCAGLVLYLQLLDWMGVTDMKDGWNYLFTPVSVSLFFSVLYLVWRWLYPAAAKRRPAHEQ